MYIYNLNAGFYADVEIRGAVEFIIIFIAFFKNFIVCIVSGWGPL